MTQPAVPNAPMWRRFAAMAYELPVLFALAFAATLPLVALNRPAALPAAHLGYQLYLLAVFKLYFLLGWRYGGQTLGMRPWRLFLAPARAPLSWRLAMLRFWVALFSWLPAGLGYLWMIIDREKRAWPDLATGTRVVWREN